MRKRSLLSLLLAVCLLLCACARTGTAVQDAETAQLPVLHIGTAIFAPYFYMGEDGSYTGVDHDIAVEACTRMGYTPEFTVMDWGDRDEVLASGRIDCVWNCFIMTGRENDYQWAGPYLNTSIAVLVPADSDIQSAADLAGKTIALRVGSRQEAFFLENPNAPAVRALSTYGTMRAAFTAFGKGYADAVVEHKAALQQMIAADPSRYRCLEKPLFVARAGVGFAKDADASTVQALNDVLAEMQADGTIAAIAQQYGLDERDYGKVGDLHAH